MGNTLGSKRAAKVMKINGETMKFKTPIQASKVVENHPGHVLLESEAVKHFGIRAKPLDPTQELKQKRLYFLVELPRFQEDKNPRRVRSGIHMSAKDRLESLMLARRSVSDLSIMRSSSIMLEEAKDHSSSNEKGAMRLKMRIPKSEVEKLMMESKNEDEAAEKLVDFCKENHASWRRSLGGTDIEGSRLRFQQQYDVTWKQEQESGMSKRGILKSREKRVGFHPMTESEIQLAVAS